MYWVLNTKNLQRYVLRADVMGVKHQELNCATYSERMYWELNIKNLQRCVLRADVLGVKHQ